MPLSCEQKELWKLSLQGEPDWCCSVNILLRGPFRLEKMQCAIQRLVDRHEALHTTISGSDTGTVPVQTVHSTLNAEVQLVDLTHLAGQAQDAAVTDWQLQQAKTPFALSDGPLMRTAVLKLAEELHLLAIDVHHIVSDGWSINILLSELTTLYHAACQAVENQLEIPHQYREFIEWQAKTSQSDAAQETYWQEQFRAGFPIADLPTDYPRSHDISCRGDRYSARFDAQLTSQIKQFARSHHASLFMTLLSVYGLLLHRLTGQDELVIGTPTAGRSFEHSKEMVGYCTHFLPIYSCWTKNQTINEYLIMLKKTILDAYEHQDYPFARLLSKHNEQNEQNRQNEYPLLTTIFNVDRSIPAPELYELQTEFLPAFANFALVDFRLDVIEINGELWLDYDYRTDLFAESTIERWHNDFQCFLKEIMANPEANVADLFTIQTYSHPELV
ncbi:MAG: condensation domain-containing protein [Chloroflexota bacterium]